MWVYGGVFVCSFLLEMKQEEMGLMVGLLLWWFDAEVGTCGVTCDVDFVDEMERVSN